MESPGLADEGPENGKEAEGTLEQGLAALVPVYFLLSQLPPSVLANPLVPYKTLTTRLKKAVPHSSA